MFFAFGDFLLVHDEGFDGFVDAGIFELFFGFAFRLVGGRVKSVPPFRRHLVLQKDLLSKFLSKGPLHSTIQIKLFITV